MQLATPEARDSGVGAPAGHRARSGSDSALPEMLWGSCLPPFQTRVSVGKLILSHDRGIWKKHPGVSHCSEQTGKGRVWFRKYWKPHCCFQMFHVPSSSFKTCSCCCIRLQCKKRCLDAPLPTIPKSNVCLISPKS